MSTTSWRSPGTVASQTRSGGSVSWTNPSNAVSSNDSYATATTTPATPTHWLWCTNFGFTISDVPSEATITGLEVRFERKASYSASIEGMLNTIFKAIKASAETGTQKTSSTAWETSDTVSASQGGNGDVWGTTFTSGEAIHANTGVAIAYEDTDHSTANLSVDNVEMRWHYTLPSTRRRGSGMI